MAFTLINTELKHRCALNMEDLAAHSSNESIPNEISTLEQCDFSWERNGTIQDCTFKTPDYKQEPKTDRSENSNYGPETIASTSEKHEQKELKFDHVFMSETELECCTNRNARIQRNLMNKQYKTSVLQLQNDTNSTAEFNSWIHDSDILQGKSNNVLKQIESNVFESILIPPNLDQSNSEDNFNSEQYEACETESCSFESENSDECSFSNNSSDKPNNEDNPLPSSWEENMNEQSNQSLALSSVMPSTNMKVPPLTITKVCDRTIDLYSAPNSDRTKPELKEVNWNLLIDELSSYSVNRNRSTKVKLK